MTRLAAPDDLAAATRALADTLAHKLPAALALGKRGAVTSLAGAYAVATPIMVENLLSPDTAEGIAAFLDKRPPSWA